MARVTVEDCITKIPNRFDLVLCASHRTRQLSAGAPMTIERDNDKLPVIALREIAKGKISSDSLQASLIQSMRRTVQLDDSEQEMAEMLSEEQDSFEIGGDSFEERVLIDRQDDMIIIGADGNEIIEDDIDFEDDDISDDELDAELAYELETEK